MATVKLVGPHSLGVFYASLAEEVQQRDDS
jgi:hypothetical protein